MGLGGDWLGFWLLLELGALHSIQSVDAGGQCVRIGGGVGEPLVDEVLGRDGVHQAEFFAPLEDPGGHGYVEHFELEREVF